MCKHVFEVLLFSGYPTIFGGGKPKEKKKTNNKTSGAHVPKCIMILDSH